MSTDFFRPTQFTYDQPTDTIRRPAGETLRPSGKHPRNRALRYRTTACNDPAAHPHRADALSKIGHRLPRE